MKKLHLFFFIIGLNLYSQAQNNSCYSRLEKDTLTIGNNRIERKFIWNNGNLITSSLTNKDNKRCLKSISSDADFFISKGGLVGNGFFEKEWVCSDNIHQAYLMTSVICKIGTLSIKRVFKIKENCPTISCDTYIKGNMDVIDNSSIKNVADNKNIESNTDMTSATENTVLDRLNFAGQHWHAKTVEFWDVTDWNNNLTAEHDVITYRKNRYRGNLLFAVNGNDNNGFFFLKEAPCSNVQLEYKGADFITEFGKFIVTGLGIKASDIIPDKWTRTYGCVVGVFDGSELSALKALRNYQKSVRILNANRDEMIMENTWGDRNQDTKINETFCLHELDCMQRLGITHFQLDDGWQKGKSPNSAMAKGSFKDIWREHDYWTPDSNKFPHGLYPIIDKAKKLGINICLWFNPSIQNDFADWEKDADAIIDLYRKYDIKTFKIDGLNVTSKKGEENLRNMFEKVWKESKQQVSFNLDATANRREGYHYFNEYGNIFLENRYTDWNNYYPYMTLRNLWMLSKYVPAEKIQIEFLNKWRNGNKYGDDRFAPSKYSFDYLFATTMAGQPLAWMETSALPDEAFKTKETIEIYKKVQHQFHSGIILPIGDEPSGSSWTGFQSITNDNEGYFIIYRENNLENYKYIKTWLKNRSNVSLTPILGHGKKYSYTTNDRGEIKFDLSNINDFVMYKYIIE